MSARVGVILSGSGFQDGTEITEAVAILIALDRRGADILCMAPDIDQAHTIDHRTGKTTHEKRNVLVESARIARGKIRDLATIHTGELDALILPGGFGAAKNLSTFATDGAKMKIDPQTARIMNEIRAARKPIGLACIAPVIAAKLFAEHHPSLTIGSDPATAEAIEKMGGHHHNAGPAEIWVDPQNRLVSTPCYMNDVGPWTIYQGAERMVEEVLRMSGDTASLIRGQMATLQNPPG